MPRAETLRSACLAALTILAFLFQETWALAGTTGALSGSVTGNNGAPVAGATVTVSSLSQRASTTTDAGGHFSFISLAPDTYTLSVEKTGFTPSSTPGIAIFADQRQTLAIALETTLKTIGIVRTSYQGSLVKSGSTTDVYAVNAATAAQLATSGGGNNLNSAYSAIYAQPGVVGLPGNFGFGQVFYIHGSAYNQIGYEFDGVPVNRSFDNYNANSLSNLGTTSTEVYTGGGPADAVSPTLGGYINQIIQTGTYPGSLTGALGVGGPGFNHLAQIAVGGATPDRTFSYYVALRGDNMIPLQFNAQNGANLNPDGNNVFGQQGFSLNTLYFPFTEFGFVGKGNGPWSDCNTNGSAPANGSFLSPAITGAYGVSGPMPTCNYYSSIAATNAVTLRGNDLNDRESVANFHFAIPHKNGSGRDDLQILFDNFYYQTLGWDNLSTVGGLNFLNSAMSPAGTNPNGTGNYNTFLGNFGLGLPATQYPGYTSLCDFENFLVLAGAPPCASSGPSPVPYFDGYQVHAAFGQSALGSPNIVSEYYFPSTPTNRPFQSGFSPYQVGSTDNNGSIFKLQYQHEMGANAYLRVYGYSFYSDWLQNDPNFSFIPFAVAAATSGDYEVNTHTRGLNATLVDQLSAAHLLTVTGSYTTATSARNNNAQYEFSPTLTPIATLGSGGTCYAAYNNQQGKQLIDAGYAAGLTAGTPVSCLSALAGATIGAVQAGACPVGSPALSCLQTPAGLPSGTTWSLTQNIEPDANINTVGPKIWDAAVQDDWRPNDRLDVNAGVRFESYGYQLGDVASPEQAFWFNQINQTACVDPSGLEQAPGSDINPGSTRYQLAGSYPAFVTTAPGAACPFDPTTGHQLYHPGSEGIPLIGLGQSGTVTNDTASPRAGFTYSLSPNRVIRASFGRYTEPTPTAFEQVLTYADGYQMATNLYNSKYYNLGLSTIAHLNPIQFSNNADVSYEQRLNGTDWSYKISPFYRYTVNQSVEVALPGGLSGAFNSGTQKTDGVELAVQKGDPSRNGWSGQLSYTYTDAKLKYALINGGNIVSTMLNAVKPFLSLERVNGGSPCYVSGVGQACAPGVAGEIANPYYNETITQAQLSNQFPLTAYYPTYANIFPDGLQSGDAATAIPPNVFAGYVSWKHNKLQTTVTANLWQGFSYGSPVDVAGVDPRSCSANQGQSGIVSGSLNADYQTCTSSIAIPNPYSGQFTNIGAFRDPWDFNLGLQFGYDLTPNVRATLQLANVLNRCFGGTPEPWTAAFKPNSFICEYTFNTTFIGVTPGAGYFYGTSGHDPVNGTAGYPTLFDQAYAPTANQIASPFQAYFQVQVRL